MIVVARIDINVEIAQKIIERDATVNGDREWYQGYVAAARGLLIRHGGVGGEGGDSSLIFIDHEDVKMKIRKSYQFAIESLDAMKSENTTLYAEGVRAFYEDILSVGII